MKKTVTALAACAIALTAGAQTPKAVNQNPFLAPYTTPYEIPPFEQIKVSDYIPALKAGIEQHNKEIAAIANSKAEPTFENVILAMDRAGDILEKVVCIRRTVRVELQPRAAGRCRHLRAHAGRPPGRSVDESGAVQACQGPL